MRLRTYSPQFSNIVVPVPTVEEQDSIVSYLDWQVSKINKVIATYRRQIKLLQEHKQTSINMLIAAEVDFADLIKPKRGEKVSGIPDGWTLCALKYVSDIYNGNSMSNKDEYEEVTSIPYIATKDIDAITGKTNYDNGLYVSETSNFKIAPKGSTLLCIEGGSAGCKKTMVIRDVAFVNKLCAFVPNGIDGKYLYYYLCSDFFAEQFRVNMTGLIGGVSISSIKRIIIFVPPLKEQERIAEALEHKCNLNDSLIKTLKEKIHLLQELRDGIVIDAVTGKIDVRGIEIPDYEYIEEESDDTFENEEEPQYDLEGV